MSCKYYMDSSFGNFSKPKLFTLSLMKDFIKKIYWISLLYSENAIWLIFHLITTLKWHSINMIPSMLPPHSPVFTGCDLCLVGIVVGSLEILGNPTGLIRSIGTGVADLVKKPYAGLTQGPGAFVTGVSSGMSSFVRNISAGRSQFISVYAGARPIHMILHLTTSTGMHPVLKVPLLFSKTLCNFKSS